MDFWSGTLIEKLAPARACIIRPLNSRALTGRGARIRIFAINHSASVGLKREVSEGQITRGTRTRSSRRLVSKTSTRDSFRAEPQAALFVLRVVGFNVKPKASWQERERDFTNHDICTCELQAVKTKSLRAACIHNETETFLPACFLACRCRVLIFYNHCVL